MCIIMSHIHRMVLILRITWTDSQSRNIPDLYNNLIILPKTTFNKLDKPVSVLQCHRFAFFEMSETRELRNETKWKQYEGNVYSYIFGLALTPHVSPVSSLPLGVNETYLN